MQIQSSDNTISNTNLIDIVEPSSNHIINEYLLLVEQAANIYKEKIGYTELHPLHNLAQKIDEKLQGQQNPQLGAHFHGLGGSSVLWHNLRIDKTENDLCFQFKLNHYARIELEKRLNTLSSLPAQNGPVTRELTDHQLGPITIKNLLKITYMNLENQFFAQLLIGNDPECPAFYNNVEIKIPYSVNNSDIMKSLYIALDFLGLSDALKPSTDEDRLKLKIARLFHLFAPKGAAKVRTNTFFHRCTVEQMKTTCSKLDTKMQSVFQKYLSDEPNLIREVDTPLGKTLIVDGIGEGVKNAGLYGLYSTFTFGEKVYPNAEDINDRLIPLLKCGLISSEDRFRSFPNKKLLGLSSATDLASGSGAEVFTRPVMALKNMSTDKIFILFHPSILDLPGYWYTADNYGAKNAYVAEKDEHYRNRNSVIEIPQTQVDTFPEVMTHHMIEPKYITCIFTCEAYKEFLIEKFKNSGAFPDGRINGKTFDEFIRVDKCYERDMFYLSSKELQEEMWEHQKILHQLIENNDFIFPSLNKDVIGEQLAIGIISKYIARPIYNTVFPQRASRLSGENNEREQISFIPSSFYKKKIPHIFQKKCLARTTHGLDHALRVALWTQLLQELYGQLGRTKTKEPVLLGTAGLLHDGARENEDIDYWDSESAKLVEKLFKKANLDQAVSETYIQAIENKDPKDGIFTTDEQRIVHDADCLEYMRISKLFSGFRKENLCFSQFEGAEKIMDALLPQIQIFIHVTMEQDMRHYFAFQSKLPYIDLIRCLYSLHKHANCFSEIIKLCSEEMKIIGEKSPPENNDFTEMLKKYGEILNSSLKKI